MSGVATLFLDTNVLVYARDRSELIKGPHAQDLLSKIFQKGPPLISVQMLSEFFWTVTRKLPLPLNPAVAS
jgi:predicted nucleic acid-binding protein